MRHRRAPLRVRPALPAGRSLRRLRRLRFTAESLGLDVPEVAPVAVADLDLDGAADVVFGVDGRFGRAVLAAATPEDAATTDRVLTIMLAEEY